MGMTFSLEIYEKHNMGKIWVQYLGAIFKIPFLKFCHVGFFSQNGIFFN